MSQTTELGLLLYANVKNFVSGMEKAEREFVRVGKRMEDIGKTLSVGVSLPLAGLGIAAVSSAMKMESLEKGLIAVSGSSEAAQLQLERLKDVAKLPGLGLEEAVQGSVNLQAAGFSAEEAEASLRAFGNALATVGKGRAELDGVILALGQIQSKGKVSAEEINQLAERVPQIRQVMVEAFGTAVPEEIGKAGISAKEFVNTVTTELLKLPQVTGGLGNAFENLQDATTTSLARVGDAISRTFSLESLFNGLAAGLDEVSIAFEQLNPSAQGAIIGIGAAAIAIGPLIAAVGFFSTTIVPQFVKGMQVLKISSTSALGPIGLVVLAIGALGAGIASFSTESDAAADAQRTLTEVSRQAESSIAGEVLKVQSLTEVAKDEKRSKEERKRAIEELNRVSPEYFGNLSIETINTDKAKESLDKYIESLQKAAKGRALEAKLQDLNNQRLDIEQEKRESTFEGIRNLAGFAGISVGKSGFTEGLQSLAAQEKAVVEELRNLYAEEVVVEKKTQELNTTTTKSSSVYQDLAKDLVTIDSRYKVFGESIDVVAEKQDAYTSAIEKLINEGVNPASNKIAALREELLKLDDQVRAANQKKIDESGIGPIAVKDGKFSRQEPQGLEIGGTAEEQMLDDLGEKADALAEKNRNLEDTYKSIGTTIGGVFAQALSDTKNFSENGVQIIAGGIAEIIKMLYAQAVASYIANSAALGPLGIAFASASVPIVGALFDSLVPKLAEGGITTGPTLAMVGDNRSGRELILPLERAKEFMGGGGGPLQITHRVSGQDLLLIIDRTTKANKRSGGRS